MTKPEDDPSSRRTRRQASYDRLAAWYDLLAGRSEQQLAEQALNLLDLQTGERVLEMGSGTGHALKYLAEKVGETGWACGLDLSSGMLRQAQHNLGKAGRECQVGLVNGDALRLPFLRGSFNAVFMSFTLELFDDDEIGIVLGECGRVLTPGGRLCVVSLAQEESEGWMGWLYRQAQVWFPYVVDCRPIRVEKMLEKNGFVVKQIQASRLWGLLVKLVEARTPAPR